MCEYRHCRIVLYELDKLETKGIGYNRSILLHMSSPVAPIPPSNDTSARLFLMPCDFSRASLLHVRIWVG
jgi:hypothetical protein